MRTRQQKTQLAKENWQKDLVIHQLYFILLLALAENKELREQLEESNSRGEFTFSQN